MNETEAEDESQPTDYSEMPQMDQEKMFEMMRRKLFDMFRSPLKDEYRDEAFKWVLKLCMERGDFTWMTLHDSWHDEEVKSFLSVARLSMNEILLLIPLIQRHLTCGNEPEIEDGRVIERPANQSDYDKFGDHLAIFEYVFKTLIIGDKEPVELGENSPAFDKALPDRLSNEELRKLLDSIKETMNSICDYLEVVHRYWERLEENKEREEFYSAQGALRVMCAWMSEEPTIFKSQAERFLIDLITKMLISSSGAIEDIFILGLHSICTSDEEMMGAAKKNPKFRVALERYLDHVRKEKHEDKSKGREKKFKLRCGLVKDLMSS